MKKNSSMNIFETSTTINNPYLKEDWSLEQLLVITLAIQTLGSCWKIDDRLLSMRCDSKR